MIKRHINLKTTRLKQARRPSFSKGMPAYALDQRVSKSAHNIRQNHAAKLNSYFIKSDRLSNYFRDVKVEEWVSIRILDFLNRVRNVENLTEIKERKNAKSPYSIGITVAQRILNHRSQLAPHRRFTTLAQLENIEGFGSDKFNDLVDLLGVRADDAFKDSMYDGLLFDNWNLNVYHFDLESEADFQKIVYSESSLKDFVGEKVGQLILKRNNHQVLSRLVVKLIKSSYIESFTAQEYAAVALAFWLYQVDMDNWFSLDRVLEKTRLYFAHYDRLEHRLELRLLKGFPNSAILVDHLTTEDLPIVINHGERSLSIWTVQLND